MIAVSNWFIVIVTDFNNSNLTDFIKKVDRLYHPHLYSIREELYKKK